QPQTVLLSGDVKSDKLVAIFARPGENHEHFVATVLLGDLGQRLSIAGARLLGINRAQIAAAAERDGEFCCSRICRSLSPSFAPRVWVIPKDQLVSIPIDRHDNDRLSRAFRNSDPGVAQ